MAVTYLVKVLQEVHYPPLYLWLGQSGRGRVVSQGRDG